ncbi:type II toxin-antitoxin system Phd/YefM family antitoxin [Actinomycetota bacterium]
METVGLRELRQDASGLLRRVERGEEIVITVSGRPSARLVPARQTRWHRWDDLADLFAGPGDADWRDDRELVDDAVSDPWAKLP